MSEIEITFNAKVECKDGHCGHAKEVIVNPVKKKVTHFVVKDEGLPDENTRLVPIEKVSSATTELIRLDCDRDEFIRMEPFITSRYVAPDQSLEYQAYWGADSFVDPMVVNPHPEIQREMHVPVGEIALFRGMDINATDGKIGQVDEIVVDSEGNLMTHILMRKGHLWGKKEISIPISAIDNVYENEVNLNVDRDTVKNYPTVPVKRHHADG